MHTLLNIKSREVVDSDIWLEDLRDVRCWHQNLNSWDISQISKQKIKILVEVLPNSIHVVKDKKDFLTQSD
jgi:hypothetical protein